MEKLRNRIDLRLVSYKKEYLTWTSKPNYTSQRIFDNDLVAIRNSKVILKFNRPAYVRICISICTNSIMIILKINMEKKSRLLFTDSETSGGSTEECVGLKAKDVFLLGRW